ncbi:Transcription factor IIIB, Bdp1 subunit [Penicillium griseofulvum]|uniref:Transcription factor IIIB, Bdp1 subunit n=1 Tax=Penicillium patulum TaxID=5078 RepID=A0A135LN07_PENPA|nr:Transcription factor IIIB, Bdp1 subunit [Penicillium griseofulvum]KXG50346.1 Transcription factor IIIB, Bdp1 subunit [Penicillium griseofulvum]
MKSFSSSAINKTGKKFAPKAPIRRAPAAPARRPSVAQQSPAEPVQENKAKDVTDAHLPPSLAAEPEPRAITEASPASIAAPTREQTPITLAAPQVATPVTTVAPAITTQTVTPIATPIAKPTPISKPTAIPKPTPIPKPAAISKPTPIPKPAAIPRPQKRDASTSVSQPTPVSTAPPTPPSTQPTPSPANVSSEAQPPSSEAHGPEKALLEYARIETARAAEHLVDSTETLPQSQPEIEQTAPSDGRPTKRARTSSTTSIAAPARKKSASAAVSRRGSQSIVPTIEDASATPGESNVSTPDPTKPKKRKYSKAGTSDPEGSEKPKRTRKKREPTPEGAETVEILPNVVKMSELCKDLRTGKKSKRETELRKIDKAEEERKKQGGTPGPGTPVKQTEAEQEKTEQPVDWKPQSGPIMRIVNGEIVLDNTSLQVDRHADAARAAGDLEDVVESSFTRKINQASYGKRTKTETWDEEMTDLFYRGLRMFGTDFMVISKMFPGRSRRQIKLKFNNEERRDPQRIKDTLMGPSETIDIATYSEMTNTVYDDPKIVQQELDDEKQRIEAQHAKEKELQEDMLRNPTSDSKDDKNDKTVVKKSRKKVGLKNQGGGTEEVLGSIDDFPSA